MAAISGVDVVEGLRVPDAVQAAWDELAVAAQMPPMAPAWALAYARHLTPSGSDLRTLVMREDGAVVGVAPFLVTRRRGLTSYSLPGASLSSWLSPLALPGREAEVAAAVAATLRRAYPRPAVLALDGLPAASPWPHALEAAWPGRIGPFRHRRRVAGAPLVSLGHETFDAWLGAKSSNFRSQMRRLRRKFADAGGTLRATTEATLREDAATFLRLHTARWEGRSPSTIAAHGAELLGMLVEAGGELLPQERFRMRVLELDGEPISALLFLSAGGRVLYVNGGWDERFARFKPSMLTLLDMVEECLARDEQALDLGDGEQAYKLRFADARSEVAWDVLLPVGPQLPVAAAAIGPGLAARALAGVAERRLRPEDVTRLRELRGRVGVGGARGRRRA